VREYQRATAGGKRARARAARRPPPIRARLQRLVVRGRVLPQVHVRELNDFESPAAAEAQRRRRRPRLAPAAQRPRRRRPRASQAAGVVGEQRRPAGAPGRGVHSNRERQEGEESERRRRRGLRPRQLRRQAQHGGGDAPEGLPAARGGCNSAGAASAHPGEREARGERASGAGETNEARESRKNVCPANEGNAAVPRSPAPPPQPKTHRRLLRRCVCDRRRGRAARVEATAAARAVAAATARLRRQTPWHTAARLLTSCARGGGGTTTPLQRFSNRIL